MYEDRLKKISKMESSIEKQKVVIVHKKTRCEELTFKRLQTMFKNKFNVDNLSVEFKKPEEKNHYIYYKNNTPDLIINYSKYSIKINNEGEIGNISDWYGFGEEIRDDWHDYLIFLGLLSSAMKNKKPIHTFFHKKFKELGELHTNLEESIKECKEFKSETDELILSKMKRIASTLIEEGMRFEFEGQYINGIRSCTMVDITSVKNKTYLCSVHGTKEERFGPSMGWYDTYIKHDDLHRMIINSKESWPTDFKRKFNLEIFIGDE